MSGEPGMVEVLLREIPEAFRGPGFCVVRNNVYELLPNKDGVLKKHLVTQLQEVTRLRLPAEQVGRLMQGLPVGTSTLATVGSACSVATLGVAIVGFAALGFGLYRIGKRLESVQAGVERIAADTAALADAVALLDLKVDHLLLLSREQGEGLRQIHYQLHLRDFAEIRGALETLDVRSGEPASSRRDADITKAVDGLQVHRMRFSQWLADCPDEAGNVAVELAQATTLLALGESRGRLLLGDTAFAERVLDLSRSTLQHAAKRATSYATNRWNLTSLLACEVPGLDVPDLLARTVGWATGTTAEIVAAGHLRRVVLESGQARDALRAVLKDEAMTHRLVDLTADGLIMEMQRIAPKGIWAEVTGRTRAHMQVGPLALLSLELDAIRSLRSKVVESVRGFGDPGSPASTIAGFDAYMQCGQRLETSLLGVRVGSLLGWEDERVKALAVGTDAAAVLRPSFQVELLSVAA